MTDIETQKLGYEQWIGASYDELGLSREGKTITTDTCVSTTGQHLKVVTVDARPVDGSGARRGEVIIGAAPFDGRVDERVEKTALILASQRQALYCYVETPGVTSLDRGGYQTSRQVGSLLNGRFDEIAKSQLGAIDSVLHLTASDDVTLVGRSMGAASVSAMARALITEQTAVEANLHRIIYLDPINIRSSSVVHMQQLGQRVMEEDKLFGPVYQNENAELAISFADQEARRGSSSSRLGHSVVNLLLGTALRRGFGQSLVDLTKASRRFQQVEHIITRPADSTVSSDAMVQSLAEAIRSSGGKARAIRYESGNESKRAGHNVLDSLGRAATFATSFA